MSARSASFAASLCLLGLALAAACSPKEPAPPPPLPAPSAAPPPPTPQPEPEISAAPAAPPPTATTFPALAPAERAEKIARAEALLEGGVVPPNDGPRNPRSVSISVVGEAGASGHLPGDGVETCRHRLLAAPPAEMKGKVLVDATGLVTGAKLDGPASAKAFAACAESALLGRKITGPAGEHNIVLLFHNAAASK